MISLSARPLAIPFKAAFRHASAERAETQSVWVEARSGAHVGFGEGCPREYVTAETLDGALRFVAAGRERWGKAIGDVEALRAHVSCSRNEIDRNPAAWCAVELALLDLFAKTAGASVEAWVGVSRVEGTFRYTAVIGDSAPAAFDAQLRRYLDAGFRQFKIKLSGDALRDRAKAASLAAAGVPASAVRADANNLFRDAASAIAHLHALGFAFAAVEEPVQAGDFDGMRRVATIVGTRIVLDESLRLAEPLRKLRGEEDVWIPNIRVSKMGGLWRSLEVAREAKRMGMPIVVGAHVGETSVLTRAALTVASAAGEALWAQEGAFGTHLLERDVVEPPLMFGARGELKIA
jgi:L-alanine-DL-glutamate epimerase-like enolase superfamily enzyme